MDSLKEALLAASSCSGDSSDRDYLIIDSDFRTISIPRNKRVLGVYNDTSVNRVWFRAPRYYGDIDLSTYNFKINYINAQEDGDIYLVDDVTVDSNDIIFSWLVGYTAFLVEGNVIFNVCATLLNEIGDTITNEFNTTVHTLPVLKGLEIDEEYIRTHYPSFIDQIEAFKNAAETAASSALESKNAAKDSEIAAESSKNSAATSAEEALNSKTQAAQSAESALNSKTAAEESKTAAIDAKNSAESAAREALESKDAAKSSEDAAKRSETASKESETNASNSAAAAALSEQNALTFKNAASISETNAKASETNALNSATSASRSATNAQESAERASTAAFNAGLNAESARDNALAAQSSAEQANSSAISAGLNATSASRDAETASSKANEASSSATEAKNSENAAKVSENAAKLSENNAKTSETNASRSETNSAENATRAEQAAENAEDFVENVVLVQPEQPTEENNRIWIKQGADRTVQVPTFQELLEVKKSKAGILKDTVSGSVASFVPDATIPNLLGLDVALEPIQDLHGYDSPWPAGGGVNKIPYPYTSPDGVYSGVEFVTTGEKIHAVGTTNNSFLLTLGTATLPAGDYSLKVDGNHAGVQFRARANNSNITTLNPTNASASFSLSESTVVTFDAVRSGVELNCDTHIWCGVKTSYADATFSPYSNICPISGLDSVEVEADGVNLFDINGETSFIYTDVSIQNDKIVISSIGSGATSRVYFVKTYKPGTYTFSAKMSGQITSIRFFSPQPFAGGTYNSYYGGYFADLTNGQKNVTMTEPFTVGIIGTGTAGGQGEVYDIQLEIGSTASAYETYQGTTYTIPLPETVYGGDIGVVSGDGESKMGMVDLGTLDWSYYNWSPHGLFYAIVEGKSLAEGNVLVCSALKYLGSAYGGSAASRLAVDNSSCISAQNSGDQVTSQWVYVRADEYGNDVAAFKAAMSGVMLCYELATPTSLSTTPTEISTVEGQNNVFSPDGDVTVEYAADLKTYIDNKIAAAVAALS